MKWLVKWFLAISHVVITCCRWRHRVRLSHLLAEVEHLADEIAVLKLVTSGTLASLQQAGTSVRTTAAIPLTNLLTAAGASVHTGTEGELVVRGIGGAVTTSVLVLFLIPPLVVQPFSGAGS